MLFPCGLELASILLIPNSTCITLLTLGPWVMPLNLHRGFTSLSPFSLLMSLQPCKWKNNGTWCTIIMIFCVFGTVFRNLVSASARKFCFTESMFAFVIYIWAKSVRGMSKEDTLHHCYFKGNWHYKLGSNCWLIIVLYVCVCLWERKRERERFSFLDCL